MGYTDFRLFPQRTKSRFPIHCPCGHPPLCIIRDHIRDVSPTGEIEGESDEEEIIETYSNRKPNCKTLSDHASEIGSFSYLANIAISLFGIMKKGNKHPCKINYTFAS